jgi:hypothetical protein
LGAFFGLPDSVPPRGLDFFFFKFIGELTPKPADRFGGSTPKFRDFGGLGVDSPTFGSRLAKPLELFQNHKFQSILDQSNSEAMIWLIKKIQPEVGHLYISSETPEEVREMFKMFDRKAMLIRYDKMRHVNRLHIQSNHQEKSQVNHQRKFKAKTQEEGRQTNNQSKINRKSLENESVDKLFSNRFLWYLFWYKRNGIKLQENQFHFQERFVLFLFYIDMISTILWKYMIDDFSGLRYEIKFLFQKATEIFSQHYESVHPGPKPKILNYKTRRMPYDEVPKT